jgi:hypothetical protein
MASALYDKGRNAFLKGDVDVLTDTIKIALLLTTYTPDLANHDFWDDVSAYQVGSSVTLGTKDATDGVFDAADATFLAVTGNEASYIAIYKDTGTPATSTLIALLDTDVTGLPVTPNGGDIEVQWAATANKIFKL